MNNDVKFPTVEQALAYEVHGSWWARYCPAGTVLSDLAAAYYAAKVRRRYRRLLRSIDFDRRVREAWSRNRKPQQ